eukprot:scaffold239142_cov35-Tisochrysis_lutea.AAC.3
MVLLMSAAPLWCRTASIWCVDALCWLGCDPWFSAVSGEGLRASGLPLFIVAIGLASILIWAEGTPLCDRECSLCAHTIALNALHEYGGYD